METGYTKWIIVLTVVICCLLEVIDSSIVNVALSQMMGNLSATQQEVSWVVAAYAIANIIVIPMTGFLGEQFGRRNYYLGSIVVFTLASMMCGQSTNIWELVAFRFIQGVGGAALVATSQAILVDTFPPKQLPIGQALFGMGVIIGPTIGPTLGGWIVDNYDWPWIFYVNVPVGILAGICTIAFIHDPERIKKAVRRPLGQIDWAGVLLLILGVGALQYVLEQGESKDWFETPSIVVGTILATIGVIGFVWRELTAREPIVDLRVLGKSRNLAIGAFLSFILGFGLFASVFVLPIFCQRILGFSANQTGYLLFPSAMLSGFMMPVIGKLLQSGVSAKYMLPVGFVLFFAFCYWMGLSISPTAGEDTFYWPLMLRGFALAIVFLPISSMSLTGVSGKDAGQAAGLTGMIRQLGGSFGVALAGTFLERTTAQNRVALLPHISTYSVDVQQRLAGLVAMFMSKGSDMVQAQKQAYIVMEGMLMKQVAIITYAQTFQLIGFFFLMCLPLAFFIRKARPGEKVDASAAH
jgi:DHA2 family multidrug resistance protein